MYIWRLNFSNNTEKQQIFKSCLSYILYAFQWSLFPAATAVCKASMGNTPMATYGHIPKSKASHQIERYFHERCNIWWSRYVVIIFMVMGEFIYLYNIDLMELACNIAFWQSGWLLGLGALPFGHRVTQRSLQGLLKILQLWIFGLRLGFRKLAAHTVSLGWWNHYMHSKSIYKMALFNCKV